MFLEDLNRGRIVIAGPLRRVHTAALFEKLDLNVIKKSEACPKNVARLHLHAKLAGNATHKLLKEPVLVLAQEHPFL